MSTDKRLVIQQFEYHHSRSEDNKFIVPLPKNGNAGYLGESRMQGVRRFHSLERSLNTKGCFKEFDSVMREYLELGHAEVVPTSDLEKPPELTFYLPMHAVYKASSTTTKIRAVFDASAKSSTGVSRNDTLLVGPTVHSSLIDVLLRFRKHPIALTADVSKMYRAVKLASHDKDLHRFVWRSSAEEPLVDYRMTSLTFGVSASSFAANMAVKQNAIDYSHEYPLAAEIVHNSFYIDDCLTGAADPKSAMALYQQLVSLFSKGGFDLRKWNSNAPGVLQQIPKDIRAVANVQILSKRDKYSKTLGIEWNAVTDQFRIFIANTPTKGDLTKSTKRGIASDIAKVFDVLGFFLPTTIKMKILLQRLWEIKLGWDEEVPKEIMDNWIRWRLELPLLADVPISRCYLPCEFSRIVRTELHGFSDASEEAYGAVIYMTVLDIPISLLFARTDSTIVLSWLKGNPRRFKTYVGNRISFIIDQLPPERWNHVPGIQNPADCASRGLFPAELKDHKLWWEGPEWLRMDPSRWPKLSPDLVPSLPCEERNLDILTATSSIQPGEPFTLSTRFSSFTRLKRVTTWVFRFSKNARRSISSRCLSVHLTVPELNSAENFWLMTIQQESFQKEASSLQSGERIMKTSQLISLRPFWDGKCLLIRVGGRITNSTFSFSQSHPVILDGKHPLTKLLIRSVHLRLMHAGPTLLLSSLGGRFYIIGARNAVRFVTRNCIICKRQSIKPQNQLLGQLPHKRVSPAPPFQRTGVDYAGPFQVKYGHVRKPTIVKTYICLFVCLVVKAVHLKLVSDLTTEVFLAAFRHFVARRGCPTLIWSDHGSNFVGAKHELKTLLTSNVTQGAISDFCSINNIEWKFIPERSPHFGGLWESNVKCVKTYLKKIVSPIRFTFEEFTTVLTQIEACLNSRPLKPIDSPDEDGICALTPGHFLIGRPLTSISDHQTTYKSVSLLKRWHLCQNLVRQFWKRWSLEYLITLNKYNKWRFPKRNIAVGDVVTLRDDRLVPTRWPLGLIVQVHPGEDTLVRVVTVRTSQGEYRRPVAKIAVLIPTD